MGRLSRADLEAALTFAADLGAAATEHARADQWILERVAALISTDFAGYYHLDASSQSLHEAEYGGIPALATPDEPALTASELPFCQYRLRSGNPYFRARRLSDCVDMRLYRRTSGYALFGADPAIQMRMPGEAGTHWTLDLERTGRDFGDRDLLLLDTLRPVLTGYEAYRLLAEMVATSEVPGSAGVSDRTLSPRENAVLDLVAEGWSNAEIAARLAISSGTVKKHLENIYAKLQVGSRTAALAQTHRTVERRSPARVVPA